MTGFISYFLDKTVSKKKSTTPPKDGDFVQVSQQCYETKPLSKIGSMQLVAHQERMLAYANTSTCIIGFRGTKVTDIQDIVSDVHVLLDSLDQSERMRHAKAFVQHVLQTTKSKNVYVTGHSLGGTIAFTIGKEFHFPSVVFNPGASPIAGLAKSIWGRIKQVFQKSAAPATIFTVPQDIIAVASATWSGNHIHIRQNQASAHSLANFFVLA